MGRDCLLSQVDSVNMGRNKWDQGKYGTFFRVQAIHHAVARCIETLLPNRQDGVCRIVEDFMNDTQRLSLARLIGRYLAADKVNPIVFVDR